MPIPWLTEEIKALDLEQFSHDEEIISKLAKGFKVSTIAMTYRLTNLGQLQ